MTVAGQSTGASPGPIAAPRRALFNMAAKGASMAAERVAQLVLVLVAARLLGPAAFGRYSYAASLSVLLAFGTDLGLTIWTTRSLARDPAQGPSILGTGLRLRLIASAIVLLALGGVAAASAQTDVRWALMALGVAALCRALLDHARAVFRAHERLGDEGKVNTVIAVAATVAGLGAMALTGRSVPALAVGVLIGTVAGTVYGLARLGRGYGNWAGPADWKLARTMLRESLPFWLAGLFTLAYARGDVVVLKLLSSDAEVGAYRSAGQLVEVAKQAPVLILTALFPQLARAFLGSRSLLARLERRIAWLLLLGGIAAGAALFALSGLVVGRIFGAGFARATPTLRVLALSLPLVFVNAGLLHFFVARDRGSLNVLLAGAMVPINLLANLLLAGRFGSVGSGLATLVTEGTLTLGCLYALSVLRREDRAAEPLQASTRGPSARAASMPASSHQRP